jgi:hypothetical protein
MNIPVGKISDEARKAIEQAGGTIAPSLKQGVFMVTLPESANKYAADSDGAYVDLPGHPLVTLRFTRAWTTEECGLDIHTETVSRTIIITEQRSDDWIAYVPSKRGQWESGATQAEAVGKLHISHPDLFGRVRQNNH